MKDKYIIIAILIIIAVLFLYNKQENIDSTIPPLSNEAIQNIASVYNNQNMQVTNLKVTNDINTNNNINVNGTINTKNLAVNNIPFNNISKYISSDNGKINSQSNIKTITIFSKNISGLVVGKQCVIDIRFTFFSNGAVPWWGFSNNTNTLAGGRYPSWESAKLPNLEPTLVTMGLYLENTNSPISTIISAINISNCHEFRSALFTFTPSTSTHTIIFTLTSNYLNLQVDENDYYSYILYQIL
jgi:hypothetical protein